MKKIIIASISALTLSVSASSFASVNQDEVAYLFGTQEAVEIQLISDAEMQITEGQLFGISNDLLKGYLTSAYTHLKPIALNYANQIMDIILAYLRSRLGGFLGGFSNGGSTNPIDVSAPDPELQEGGTPPEQNVIFERSALRF